MKGYFFNAQPTTDTDKHPSGFDREYDSDDFNRYMGVFFSNGVFVRGDVDACKVSAYGLTLTVAPGIALVDGGQCHFEPGDGLPITQGAGMYSIMCRRNNAAGVRAFELVAVKGSGSFPAPVRGGDVYDLCLAHVTATSSSATVADTRGDGSVCGFAALTGQPPYYPPDDANLPYVLWLYTLGYPMTAQQKAAVEDNPSLMAIYNQTRFPPATQAEAEAGTDSSKIMTPQRVKQAISANKQTVLIKEYSTTAAAQTINLSLAGIDWASYWQVIIYITGSAATSIQGNLRLNKKSGSSDYLYGSVGSTASSASTFGGFSVGRDSTRVTLECASSLVSGTVQTAGSTLWMTYGYASGSAIASFSALTEMNLTPYDSQLSLPAGTKFTIYGVRK